MLINKKQRMIFLSLGLAMAVLSLSLSLAAPVAAAGTAAFAQGGFDFSTINGYIKTITRSIALIALSLVVLDTLWPQLLQLAGIPFQSQGFLIRIAVAAILFSKADDIVGELFSGA